MTLLQAPPVPSKPAPEPAVVQYRPVMTRRELATYLVLLSIALVLTARYALWWFRLVNVPANYTGQSLWLATLANFGPFIALTGLEALRVLQMATLWVFGLVMRSAVPLAPPTGLRVAVLTTIVPSKEPLAMLERTLAAMTHIRHPDGFDIWVLDEENDSAVRALCARLGVRHFSRHGIARYNQPSGPFRARTKAGNHNAWRDRHARDYDVVAQMDPDHVPMPDFLEKTLGYFRDPDVAYVIAPQVYYRNTASSWIARGADEQNFGFSAITQRGANYLGVPIFIGSNHLCRTAALDTVGGYASHIVEDHLTGMRLLATCNPATRRRWKGVYTEEIISLGEGPARWSSYLSQQLRWSYGLISIVQHHSAHLLLQMRPAQALGFSMIQSYYGSVAAILLTGLSLTTAHLVFGVDALSVHFGEWLGHWFPQLSISIVIWYWLQRFYLREGDRGWGVRAILVGLGAMVVYAQALMICVLGRALSYVITPKGEVGTREPLRLFRWHIVSLGLSTGSLGWSLWTGAAAASIQFWAVVNIVQMGIVIGTGVVIPRVLRSRVSWGWFDAMSTYRVRVAVPVTAGVMGLLVAAQLSMATITPGDASLTLVGAEERAAPALPAQPARGNEAPPAPSPAAPIAARFLEPGSGAVAFGLFAPEPEPGLPSDVRHEFIDFGAGSIERLELTVARATADGQVALISWEPRIAGDRERSADLLTRIERGELDSYVAAAAATLARTGAPVLLRFAPEMDHTTDDLHPWSGRPAAQFTAAWRRVHAIFRAEGAANVRFAWTPGGYFLGGTFVSDSWYPGDDVVDLVGFTAYAFWGWEEWDQARVQAHT